MLILILAASAFIHLYNPVGFPEIFYDEGVYMQRSLGVIQGHGPQQDKFYDHPFFGQLFLGSILYSIGFPDSFSTQHNTGENLYLAPRVIMGLIAVFDTFLIYKISQIRFGTKIAVFGTILFAVMPISWITRRILLDSILLPFVLLSILLALYSQKSQRKTMLVFTSGVFLGIAILTKIPAFTMIPLVVYLVYSQHKSKRLLILVLIPAILIPMIWPAFSLSVDQFDYWQKGVLWQAQRQNTGIHNTALSFAAIDPVVFGLGIAGFVYAGIKKNWFVLFWFAPFMIFLSL
ncbi:MAG: ArnT family glycosyltransferase, partial [Candidatus Nitrosotenuis sp.]